MRPLPRMNFFLPAHWRGLLLLCLTSTPAWAQSFGGAGGPISDNSIPADFPIYVSGLVPDTLSPTHGLVTVCLDIVHTHPADLVVDLLAPDGTTIGLWSHVGGVGGDFSNTCLDDGAAVAITDGSPPFSGTFHPQDLLGNMNNGNVGNGTWLLRITDPWATNQGTVNSWSLTFGANATAPLSVDSTDLPLVIIQTNGQAIPTEPKINVELGIIHNGPGLMNHPTDPRNVYNGMAGIELRGAFSSSLPQKPYAFETRTALGSDSAVALLGMPE